MNTGRRTHAGAGLQTAAIAIGGFSPGANRADCEQYNGTAWATTADLATARRYLAGCGTSSLALGFGGYISAKSALTEEFTEAAANTQSLEVS